MQSCGSPIVTSEGLRTHFFSLPQKKVVDIRGQLLRIVKSFGIQLKSCDRDMQVWYLN
jgi:hypothetical protein